MAIYIHMSLTNDSVEISVEFIAFNRISGEHSMHISTFPRHLDSHAKGLRRVFTLYGHCGRKTYCLTCGFPNETKTTSFSANSFKTGEYFCFILPERSLIMAEQSPQFKSILNQVRERLRAENVKLWLAPYTTANDEPGKYPEVNL